MLDTPTIGPSRRWHGAAWGAAPVAQRTGTRRPCVHPGRVRCGRRTCGGQRPGDAPRRPWV